MEQKVIDAMNKINSLFCIQDLVNMDYHGLLGVESATTYWGLSTYNYTLPIVLVNDDSQDMEGLMERGEPSKLYVPNVNTTNTVQLTENLYVTDLEQTVCDMIRYKRHEFHLFETLVSAIDDKDADIERLEHMAKEYGILEEMYRLLEEALEVDGEG